MFKNSLNGTVLRETLCAGEHHDHYCDNTNLFFHFCKWFDLQNDNKVYSYPYPIRKFFRG
jgi:hypothetical protein